MFKTKILRLSNDDRQFYQWDTERKLIVNDNTCDKVYFSNDGMEMALTCNIYEVDGVRMVNVPNIILQDAKPLKVHLSMVDNDGRLTTYYEAFHVAPRKKPNGYVYTETEVLNYAYLDERLKELEGEGLANAVADYLEKNPPQAGATEEESAQIQQNKADIETLSCEKLDASKLPEAVNDALAQAKESGEFKGEPGYTPQKGIDYFDGEPGEPGKTPEKGKDYFTEADKQEIAELAADMVDVPGGGNGLTDEQISALDNMFKVCAFIKANVSAEYNAFCTAFGIEGGIVPDEPDIPDVPDEPDVPTVTLTSISATYSGGDVAVGTAVNNLSGIVVTAHYSDGTSEAVTGYTLSGTIAKGSNTITVSYGGKTTTFTVTGVAEESQAVNLMTTGDLGTFADLGVYTGYDGYYNADAKTLQLTPKAAGSNANAHLKITPFVETGKTYTLFLGFENRKTGTNISASGKVSYSKTNNYENNSLTNVTLGGSPNDFEYQYIQFTVPSDAAEVYMVITTNERISTTVSNVALYEGAYTEMP